MDIKIRKRPEIFGLLNPERILIREEALLLLIRSISLILLSSKLQTIKVKAIQITIKPKTILRTIKLKTLIIVTIMIRVRTLRLLKPKRVKGTHTLFKCT